MAAADDDEGKPPIRRYDKGDRRYKHVGRTAQAEIEFVQGNPNMAVGKCPNTLTPEDCEALLRDAIIGPNGDRDVDYSKKLYVVHEGVVYECQTTTAGASYHGYPFRGRLSPKLLAALREIAEGKNCTTEFDTWVKRHIR
jgi:hypothetical protein